MKFSPSIMKDSPSFKNSIDYSNPYIIDRFLALTNVYEDKRKPVFAVADVDNKVMTAFSASIIIMTVITLTFYKRFFNVQKFTTKLVADVVYKIIANCLRQGIC